MKIPFGLQSSLPLMCIAVRQKAGHKACDMSLRSHIFTTPTKAYIQSTRYASQGAQCAPSRYCLSPLCTWLGVTVVTAIGSYIAQDACMTMLKSQASQKHRYSTVTTTLITNTIAIADCYIRVQRLHPVSRWLVPSVEIVDQSVIAVS